MVTAQLTLVVQEKTICVPGLFFDINPSQRVRLSAACPR